MKIYPFDQSPLVYARRPYMGKYPFHQRFLFLILFLFVASMISNLLFNTVVILVGRESIFPLMADCIAGRISMAEFSSALTYVTVSVAARPLVQVVSLATDSVGALALLLFFFRIDGRTPDSLGMGRPGRAGVRDMSLTLLVALLGYGCLLGISLLSGSARLFFAPQGGGWLPLYLVGFVCVAFSDVLLTQGLLLTSFLVPGRQVYTSVLVSSLFFAYVQIGSGATLLSMVNTFFLGLCLSLLTLRCGHIWAPTACLAFLRFLPCLFGMPNGGGVYSASLFSSLVSTRGTLLSGGTMGLLGGLPASAVLLLALFLLLFIPPVFPSAPSGGSKGGYYTVYFS